jgi:AcrR family transcriptional regulator
MVPMEKPLEAHHLNLISGPQSLPTIDSDPYERADAARNRKRILAAAAQLIEEHGVEHVSMDAIASEAGVGKGTLFRRFGDRSGLVMALLDERTREFQEALIRGEPPLGPGAPAIDRICAFGRGMLALLEQHGEMLLAAELGARWVRGEAGVYALYRTHLAMLVREAAPELDDEFVAEALLTPLGAETFLYLRKGRELPLERIEAGYEQLARRLLGA